MTNMLSQNNLMTQSIGIHGVISVLSNTFKDPYDYGSKEKWSSNNTNTMYCKLSWQFHKFGWTMSGDHIEEEQNASLGNCSVVLVTLIFHE